MTKIVINRPSGVEELDLAPEEEAQRTSDVEANVVFKQAQADAVAQKATNKASAKAKLIAGEALTEAEADTIVI